MRLKKICILIGLMVLIFAIDIVGSGDSLSSNSVNLSEWRMTSRDLNRTAFYPGYTPSNISLVTQITKTGLSLSSAQAAVADGFMYIADNAYLYKVNASNVSQQIDRSSSISTLYITGPTVWDTFVYVTSGSTYYQFNTSNLSSTYATYSVSSQSWANPVVYDGYVFFASTSTDLLYQANASNISKIIKNTSKTNCNSNIAINNGFMYIACSSTVFQLNISNISQTIAQYSTSGSVNNRGGITVGDGSIYFGTSSSLVYQLNASNISRYIANYTAGNTVEAGVAYAHGYVYAGSWDGNLYQLNASNVSQLIANNSIGIVYYTPVVSEDYVFVVAGSGTTYQLNANNISKIITQISTGGNFNSPTIANGIVYSHSGSTMYQFGDQNPIATTSSPANNTAYPQSPINVSFNCSATDNNGLANISLYLTNSSNDNFVLNQSSIITGNVNSSNMTVELTTGKYTWNCLAYDIDGNLDWGSNNTLYVDPIAPNTTLNLPAANYANDTWTPLNVTFNCSATDNLQLLNISLYLTDSLNQSFVLNRSSSISGLNSSVVWKINLSNGNYTWNCLAYDLAGNANWSANNRTILINFSDITPPYVSQVTPVANYVNTTLGTLNITFNCSATDSVNLKNISLYLTNNTNATFVLNQSSLISGTTNSSRWVLNMSNGNYSWGCLAYDNNGNYNWTANRSIKLNPDTTKPIVTLNSPAANYANSTSIPANVTFNCSATDDLGLANISLYLTNYANTSFTLNQSMIITGTSTRNSTKWSMNLGLGNYTWNCLVYDTSGNFNWSTTNRSITVFNDTTPPTVNITSPNNLITYQNITRINYTVTDNAAADRCWYTNSSGAWNSSAITASTNYINVTTLDGWNYMAIYCNDTSNNVGNSSITFFIDNTAPLVSFLSPTPNNGTTNFNTYLEINASIMESTLLSSITYNWNGLNYTFYNGSLVLMYNFENLSAIGENSTHIKDLSSSGNNGTTYNGSTICGQINTCPIWNSTNGRFGASYQFDGLNDYILATVTQTKKSFSFWYKNSTGSSWTHVFNASGTLYVNGLSGTPSEYPIKVVGNNVYIGNKSNSAFNGSIDEVRIWNINFTAAEVYEFYISNLQKFNFTQWYLYINQSLNASTGLPSGTYNYSIFTKDSFGTQNSSELRYYTVGSTAPTVTISYPLNTNYTVNVSAMNYSVTTGGTLDRCWYSLDNGLTNSSTVSAKINFTGLISNEGWNNWTVYCNDTFGTGSQTAVFFKDTISPVFNNLSNQTLESPTALSYNPNATDSSGISCFKVNDTANFNINCSGYLKNNTLLGVNLYWLNISVNDTFGNLNSALIWINVTDRTAPNINFTSPTEANNSFIDKNFILVNITATDANLRNITLFLYNSSQELINTTNNSSSPFFKNFTSLRDQIYYFNATATDISGNSNSTETRSVTIDTTNPSISVVTPSNNAFSNNAELDVNYSVSDLNLNSCWYSNDSMSINITLAGCANIITLAWREGQHNVTIWANDSAGNKNSSGISFTIDTTAPNAILNSPVVGYWNDTSSPFNVIFNCSATDNSALASINLYLTNKWNTSFALNQTTTITGTSNSSNWNVNLFNGNYTWNCLVYDLAGNLNWSSANRTIKLNFTDTDDDGVADNQDNLEGNETNVNTTGVSLLNITVSGNSTHGSYNGVQEIIFYDAVTKILNFTHNFSASELDLGKITTIKATNSIIVNLSGQIQSNYNKTMYLADNNFNALCVKDAEISSIDEVSSGCNGANETDFTSCLSNSATLNGIVCNDEGSTIKIGNLRYSAIRGTTAEPSSSSTSSSGGGGGGGGGIIIPPQPEVVEKYECLEDKECGVDESCWDHKCVKVFDIKILDVDSPIGKDGRLGFTYFLKGMANINDDVIINFWLDKDGKEISSGQDVIYLKEFEEKTELTKIYIPKDLPPGQYSFYIKVSYGKYQALSYRNIYVEQKGEELQVALVGQAFFTDLGKTMADYSYLWLIIFIFLIASAGVYLTKRFVVPRMRISGGQEVVRDNIGPYEPEVMSYIREARRYMNDYQITQALISVGWPEKTVMKLIKKR